jgi:hypothetical protein
MSGKSYQPLDVAKLTENESGFIYMVRALITGIAGNYIIRSIVDALGRVNSS